MQRGRAPTPTPAPTLACRVPDSRRGAARCTQDDPGPAERPGRGSDGQLLRALRGQPRHTRTQRRPVRRRKLRTTRVGSWVPVNDDSMRVTGAPGRTLRRPQVFVTARLRRDASVRRMSHPRCVPCDRCRINREKAGATLGPNATKFLGLTGLPSESLCVHLRGRIGTDICPRARFKDASVVTIRPLATRK